MARSRSMCTPIRAERLSIAALTPCRESMSVMSRSNPTVSTCRGYLWPAGLGWAGRRTTVNRMSAGPPVRSVAEWLRERTDDDLAGLLTMRPDLVSPVPPDVGMLAARATTRSSVLRALDLLDRAEHGVLEALCLLPEPATFTTLQRSLSGELALSTLRASLQTLRSLALVWGEDDALRVVATVRQVTTHPA